MRPCIASVDAMAHEKSMEDTQDTHSLVYCSPVHQVCPTASAAAWQPSLGLTTALYCTFVELRGLGQVEDHADHLVSHLLLLLIALRGAVQRQEFLVQRQVEARLVIARAGERQLTAVPAAAVRGAHALVREARPSVVALSVSVLLLLLEAALSIFAVAAIHVVRFDVVGAGAGGCAWLVLVMVAMAPSAALVAADAAATTAVG